MKNQLASIEKIDSVLPHTNADSLEIVVVRNCNVIVPKGKHVADEHIIFLWPDGILPDVAWSQFYRARSSRVKACKLRGQWSFGIVETPAAVGYTGPMTLGLDVSEVLGITKYEPPLPQDLSACGYLPHGIPKTDEENHYHLDGLPYGKECIVTRKRDGSSCSFYYNHQTDTFGILSRSMELKPECVNDWTVHVEKHDIENKLRQYCKLHEMSLCLRGEAFGSGRNGHCANVDAKETRSWEMFSVYDIAKHKYINIRDTHGSIVLSAALKLPHVPILEYCVDLTPETIRHYSEDSIGYEGVVIHCEGNTFKVINKPYDSKK
jgi:RNA ligase (TIGR02306 family)